MSRAYFGGRSAYRFGGECGLVVVLRSVTLVMRLPAKGSVAMNTLQVPQRWYS